MAYEIRVLGKKVESVESKTDALWMLGSRYGNALLMEGKKNHAIFWGEHFVKVNEILLDIASKTLISQRVKKGLRI